MSNGMRVDGRDLSLPMQEQAALEICRLIKQIGLEFEENGNITIQKTGNRISFEERRKVYTKALIAYGDRMQMTVAVEELAECQKEICKILRGGENFPHLAEEIADATIMLEQMRLFFGLNELVCQKMDQKVQRLEALLKENGLYGGERYEEWKESHCGAAEADDEVEAGLAGLAGG